MLTEKQINAIVDQVVRKLSPELSDLPRPENRPAQPPLGHADDRRGAERRFGVDGVVAGTPGRPGKAPAVGRGSRRGIFDDLDSATSSAPSVLGPTGLRSTVAQTPWRSWISGPMAR